jgi:hypothetical protein
MQQRISTIESGSRYRSCANQNARFPDDTPTLAMRRLVRIPRPSRAKTV